METTVLLAKVFGLYAIIVGLALLLRQRYYIAVFEALMEERLARAVIVFAELLGGLFLVMTHNEWSSLPAVIISAIGWIAVVEAVVFLLVPDRMLAPFVTLINKSTTYLIAGSVWIVVGVYLAGSGFGLF